MFQNGSVIFATLAFIVIGAIIYYFPQVDKKDWTLRLAMSMQLAGASGNLIDRLTQDGKVTDFISVGTFPVFNVADASISVGTVVLLLGVYLQERAALKEKAKTSDAHQTDEVNTLTDRVLDFRFEKEAHERLDKFLTEALPEFSRSRIQGLIDNGCVDVNGLPARKSWSNP